MVSLQDVRPVSKQNWCTTLIKEVMTPADRLKIAYPEQDALSVLNLMEESNLSGVPVVRWEDSG
jgi:CBS domain-containing protein